MKKKKWTTPRIIIFEKNQISSGNYSVSPTTEGIPGANVPSTFTKDNTFRHHIRSFLGQFDVMIKQARECDYDGLLIGTIGSSEVAKLYSFLCKVARRKSILKA